MKKKIMISILICFVFFSCEKNEENIVPKTEIDSEMDFKVDYYEDYIYPVAYYGDTAFFSLKYDAKTKVSNIELTFKGKNQTNEKSIQKFENVNQKDSIFFQIPITEIDFSQQFTDTYFALFIAKFINEKEEVIYTDSINVFIKPLEEYLHLRLYNIAAISQKNKGYSYQSGSSLTGISITPSSNCLNCIKTNINDSSLFLVNLPNSDFDFDNDSALTKDFVHGFYVPQGNNTYGKIKSNIDFTHIREPKDILDMYNSASDFKTIFDNIKVGDQFVFKYRYPKPFSYSCYDVPIATEDCIPHYYGDVYGLFEITHIEDDGLTSENGGMDNDYIEFRLKSFGKTYRFKK